MSDMGTFRTTILVESSERRGDTRTVESALVDTGSEYTWVPRDVLESLGIRSERTQRFIVADGRTFERPLGFAIVQFQRTFAIPEMWSGTILLGLLGFALATLFRVVERRVLFWYFGQRAAARDH